MSEKVYGCPTCLNRHTTDAWTYRTRYELGILNIDKEDIIPIAEKEKLKEVDAFFFCPSCGSSNRAVKIFEFSKPFNNTKKILETMLSPLMIKGGSIVGMKSKKMNYISVDYHKEEEAFDVRYKDEEARWITQQTGDLEETAEYLLMMEPEISVVNKDSKSIRRKRK